MKVASLALVSALAIVVGCAQPVLAQSQDQTGVTDGNRSGGMSNRDSTTSGMNRDDDDRAMGSHPGGWGDNDHMRGDGNWHHHWGSGEHRHMGGMWRHRMMLRAMGGARFHFSRGNANIDVRCSVQEDMQACVRAAGELLDKIAAMHRGVHGDTTGSATGKDMTPSAPSTAPGGGQTPRSPADEVTPKVPGERM